MSASPRSRRLAWRCRHRDARWLTIHRGEIAWAVTLAEEIGDDARATRGIAQYRVGAGPSGGVAWHQDGGVCGGVACGSVAEHGSEALCVGVCVVCGIGVFAGGGVGVASGHGAGDAAVEDGRVRGLGWTRTGRALPASKGGAGASLTEIKGTGRNAHGLATFEGRLGAHAS